MESIRAFAGIPEEKKSAPRERPDALPFAGMPAPSRFLCLRQALPEGIYPSDIGCYTLGLNLGR